MPDVGYYDGKLLECQKRTRTGKLMMRERPHCRDCKYWRRIGRSTLVPGLWGECQYASDNDWCLMRENDGVGCAVFKAKEKS